MAEHDREGIFAALVDTATAYVADGLSVHLVGPHGSGRSEILGLVADRLDDEGSTILRLHGTPAWRQEPFAALVAAGLGPASAPGPRRSVGEMSTALTQQLRGGRVVVVCDDADELDLQSVGALLTVHQQRRLVAVTASRPRLPLRADSLMLGLTPAVRLKTPVLDVDAVHALCRSVLGGPLDASALARITTASGGLPGLVRAIATVAPRAGTLRHRDGVWTLPGDLWSEHLAAAVEHYLAGADAEVWEGATALALAGPVRLGEAEEMLGRRVLDRLFTSGLVHHSGDPAGGVVGLYPPLLAEYLRHEGSAFGRAAAREPRTVGADAAVRNQRMVRRAADDVARHRGPWQADPTPQTAMPLLVSMRAAGVAAEEVEQVVAATDSEATFADARMRAWYATWQAVDQGRLADALATLDAAAQRVPEQRDYLDVTRAHLLFLRDRVPELGPLAEPEPPADAELLRVLRAELDLAAGRIDAARRQLADFRPRGRVASAQVGLLTSLASVLYGDPPGALPGVPLGGIEDPGLRQAHAYAGILGLAVSGRLAEAARLLVETLSASTVASYRDVFHTGVLVLGATIALGQGRSEYAEALAAQAAAADAGRGPFPAMDPRVVRLKLSGRPAGSLWPLVGDRIERGYLVAAVFLAVDAVELGRADAGDLPDRVHELGAAMDGPLLRGLAAYVAAAAADDEEWLQRAAEELADTGAELYAIRADLTRALLLRRTDRAPEAAALVDRIWERSAVAGPQRAGLFAGLQDDVALSARELEILALVGAPRTTQEVASHLQMSVRTVETHLHNISRKTGLSGRETLVRAATTWLRPAQR